MFFCLACKAGTEKKAQDLSTKIIQNLGIENSFSWVPEKEVSEKRLGKFFKVIKPLFPGYLFISFDSDNEEDFPFYEFSEKARGMHFLKYSDNSHRLIGSDEKTILWVSGNKGIITQSKVLFTEGQRIKIVEGPLVGFDGNVVKVDKHHKRITIRFDLLSTTQDISFSVDFLEKNALLQSLQK